MSKYIVKAKKTYLKSPLTSTATSVILRSLKDTKGNNIALSDFGDWGVVVIKQGDNIEMIKFSALATAADDSVTLTVASSGRNLDPTTPYAGSSTGLDFQSGAEVIVTNDPLTVSQLANLNIENTFAVTPKSSGAPVDDSDLVRKDYVDGLALGGSLTINRIVIAGTAGETVADGELLYKKTSDGEWYKTDGTDATTIIGAFLGIAQGAGTDGNAIAGGVLILGRDDAQTGGTAGALGYASDTAGDISTSTGTNTRVVGKFYSATEFDFNPFFFGEATNIQNGTYIYAADGEASDTYAITLTPAPTAYTAGMMINFKANTTNTGACTLNVNSLGAKSIKKNVSDDLDDGDISSGQIVTVIYDGTNFQMVTSPAPSTPVTTVYTNIFGSSTTQFDITDQGGNTFRYTYDSTGTDPLISATTVPVGTVLVIAGQNFNAANNGNFVVTASGANYFEVTNASGVAESNVTLGSGSIKYGFQKALSSGLKYIIVEVLGGGGGGCYDSAVNNIGGGGGGGGYCRALIPVGDLSATETITIGAGGAAGTTAGTSGGTSSFGAHATATGGAGASGATGGAGGDGGGTASGKFTINNFDGQNGQVDTDHSSVDIAQAGDGGSSPYGKGGAGAVAGTPGGSASQNGYAGTGYGAGGGGGIQLAAGAGTQGLVIVTQYF